MKLFFAAVLILSVTAGGFAQITMSDPVYTIQKAEFTIFFRVKISSSFLKRSRFHLYVATDPANKTWTEITGFNWNGTDKSMGGKSVTWKADFGLLKAWKGQAAFRIYVDGPEDGIFWEAETKFIPYEVEGDDGPADDHVSSTTTTVEGDDGPPDFTSTTSTSTTVRTQTSSTTTTVAQARTVSTYYDYGRELVLSITSFERNTVQTHKHLVINFTVLNNNKNTGRQFSLTGHVTLKNGTRFVKGGIMVLNGKAGGQFVIDPGKTVTGQLLYYEDFAENLQITDFGTLKINYNGKEYTLSFDTIPVGKY
jgi:hypothetical protein